MPALYTIDPNTGMPVANTSVQEIPPFESLPQDTTNTGTINNTSQVVIEPKPLPTGTSTIVEPEIIIPPAPTTVLPSAPTPATTPAPTSSTVVLPTLGGFMGSLGGGFGGGASGGGGNSTIVENKKPFPYWLIIVGLVGGYLIFKKK